MLPSEKRVRLVGKLIHQTQAGALGWQFSNRLIDKNGVLQYYMPQYEARSDGLRFVLYEWKPEYVRSLLDYQKFGVVLEIAEDATGAGMEALYEVDDLPVLKSLYQIVHRPNTSFTEKVDRFLGARP